MPLGSTQPGMYHRGKGSRNVGLTTVPHSWADYIEIWVPKPPRTLRACPVLYGIFYLCVSDSARPNGLPYFNSRPSPTCKLGKATIVIVKEVAVLTLSVWMNHDNFDSEKFLSWWHVPLLIYERPEATPADPNSEEKRRRHGLCGWNLVSSVNQCCLLILSLLILHWSAGPNNMTQQSPNSVDSLNVSDNRCINWSSPMLRWSWSLSEAE